MQGIGPAARDMRRQRQQLFSLQRQCTGDLATRREEEGAGGGGPEPKRLCANQGFAEWGGGGQRGLA